MTGPAELRVRGRGVFIADECILERGAVTATGRWRRRMGANHADVRYGPLQTCSWPISRIEKILWLTPAR